MPLYAFSDDKATQNKVETEGKKTDRWVFGGRSNNKRPFTFRHLHPKMYYVFGSPNSAHKKKAEPDTNYVDCVMLMRHFNRIEAKIDTAIFCMSYLK